MTKTSTTSTTTAFNIFLNKCKEEQKVMFPEKKLGKPNTYLWLFSSVNMFKTRFS